MPFIFFVSLSLIRANINVFYSFYTKKEKIFIIKKVLYFVFLKLNVYICSLKIIKHDNHIQR